LFSFFINSKYFVHLFVGTTQEPHRLTEVLAEIAVVSRADVTQADSTAEIKSTQEPHAVEQALIEQDLNSRVETTPEGL